MGRNRKSRNSTGSPTQATLDFALPPKASNVSSRPFSESIPTEFDHGRLMSLASLFYANSKLSDADLDELTRLHKANALRVGRITTEEPAR